MIPFSAADVNKELAYRSHSGTSMVPEKRAEQAVQDYLNHMDAVVAEFEAWATDGNRAEMIADLEQYRTGYITRLHALWHAHSRVMSTMITGPANFPTRTNRKRSDTADRRREELLEWSGKILARLRRKYDPLRIARAPISSSDSDAIAKLQAKIDKAQALQDLMKAANKIIRKKNLTDEQKVARLVTELDIKETTAHKILEPDFANRVGFPSYELTNNNANIRRMENRIAQLQAETQSRESTPNEYEIGGVLVVENADLNRLQICFEDKPPVEIRTRLKAHGFRWSPRNMAWQRLLNNAAREAARVILTPAPVVEQATLPLGKLVAGSA